jgi:hypothetical protein
VLLARVILRPDSPRVDVHLGVHNIHGRDDSTCLQRDTAWPILEPLTDARNNGFPLRPEVIRERRICLASSLIRSEARHYAVRLTVKLRGRPEAPGRGAEGAQFLSARGAHQEAFHGPLQRLLGSRTHH